MPKQINDWKVNTCYPKAGSLSGNDWAWEFLRRNADYQEDWLRYGALVSEHVPLGATDTEISNILDADPFLIYEPPKLDGEDDAAWLRREGGGEIRHLDSVIAEKWGLCNCIPSLPNPFLEQSQQDIVLIVFDTSPRAVRLGPGGIGFSRDYPADAFVIDYRFPLDPQLKAIRAEAERSQLRHVDNGIIPQPPRKKNVRPEWPMYLRMLDAELSGATDAGIQEYFYGKDTDIEGHPNKNKTVNNLQTARAIRDGGYRWLASLPRKPKEK
jgi:hypothetical protein